MMKVRDRAISVRFNADTAASMRWNFRPQQTEIKVVYQFGMVNVLTRSSVYHRVLYVGYQKFS